jgi:hypothetical protein
MKGHHHGTRCYVAACRLAALGCLVGLGLTSQVHAGSVATASITGFVKNPTKIGGNYIRQNHVLITLENALAKAETTYVSTALGKSLAGKAVLEIAPAVAGPAIARACFAAPLVCAGVGAAAWMALSRIKLDEDEWVQEEDQWGPCYTHRLGKDGAGELDRCRGTAAEAVNAHISTLNALPGNQWEEANYTNSRVWTGSVRNMCTPALNSACHPYFQYVNTRCMKTAPFTCNDVIGEDQETISRLADQLTIIETPATEADMLTHANNYDPPEEVYNEYPGPIPVDAVKLQDSVAGIGDKYSPDDTPNEGNWVQDRVRASPNPETPDDTDLTTTTETVPVDNPNTPEVEGPIDADDPDPEPPTDPGKEEPPPFDLCAEHPNIVACQDFGEVPDDQVPESEYDMAWNAEPLGLPASCPAPLSLGSHGEYEFTAICDAAVAVSPLIVACGAIAAAMIMLAAIRGS